MILIGQFDSPFVRRVGVALTLYDMTFEHRPWSVFGDGDKIAPFNPLRRVPTLVLDHGEVLIESVVILDALDEIAGAARALAPAAGAARRRALKVCALASGLADKAVSLVYETVLHDATSDVWTERCRSQIRAVLGALESDRGSSVWWHGDTLGHADIMVGCALRFLSEAHGPLFEIEAWPRLAEHARRCEHLPAFAAICQPFSAPPPRGG